MSGSESQASDCSLGKRIGQTEVWRATSSRTRLYRSEVSLNIRRVSVRHVS